MMRQRMRVPAGAPAFVCVLDCALPAQAVGLSPVYDEALSNDAQLQSARDALAANSEELPVARAKLLPQGSASLIANRQNTDSGGGFPASNGNSNGYAATIPCTSRAMPTG